MSCGGGRVRWYIYTGKVRVKREKVREAREMRKQSERGGQLRRDVGERGFEWYIY